jgi:hypothetical protein
MHARLPLLIVLLPALAWLPGCGPGEGRVPDYDRLNVVLVHEYAIAIGKGDRELAIRKLQRLEGLLPESLSVQRLLREQIEWLVVERANQALARRDYAGARRQVDDALREYGATPRLTAAAEQVRAMAHVADFVTTPPAEDAMAFAKQVGELPAPELFASSTAYAAWHAGQRTEAAERVRRYREERVAALLVQLDTALISRGGQPTPLLAQVTAMLPQHPVAQAAANAGRQRWAPPPAEAGPVVRELVAWYYFIQGNAADRQAAAKAVPAAPVTACGELLRAWAAFAAEEEAAAWAAVRRLADRCPTANLAPLAEPLRRRLPAGEPAAPSVPMVWSLLLRLTEPPP